MAEHADNLTHPLEQIASQPKEVDEDMGSDNHKRDTQPPDIDMAPARHAALPQLTPVLVQEPAVLIDNQMRVAWQNQEARSHIWHDAGSTQNGDPKPDILTLLFDSHFRRRVENWRSWVRFFVQQAYHMISEGDLRKTIQRCDENQKEILREIIKQSPPKEERNLFSGRIRQLRNDGLIANFWVVATQFAEGRYLVFKTSMSDSKTIPAHGSADIEQRFETVRRLGSPTAMPIFTMAARLSKAGTLRTEMLADEYSQLMTRLYRQAIAGIEKYGGVFHKLAGSAFLVCFLPDPQQENQTHQVIDCAFELKRQMVDLTREWKIRKGWLHDLSLDIGLHWNEEPVAAVSSTIGDHLATFGDAQHVAIVLSRLARGGQVWSTKAFINQVPPQEQKKLRFGIFRKGHPHQVLINRCFTRLKDFSSAGSIPEEVLGGELGDIAATQIFDRQA